jgi:hypothetical protein
LAPHGTADCPVCYRRRDRDRLCPAVLPCRRRIWWQRGAGRRLIRVCWALALARGTGDHELIRETLNGLAAIAHQTGDVDQAGTLVTTAAALCDQVVALLRTPHC